MYVRHINFLTPQPHNAALIKFRIAFAFKNYSVSMKLQR